MNKIYPLLLATCTYALTTTAAPIYHCIDEDGVSVFSNTPCSENPTVVEPDVLVPSDEERIRNIERNEAIEADLNIRRHQRAVNRLEREIREAGQEITALQQARQQELDAVKAEQQEQLDRLRDRRRRDQTNTDEAEALIHQSLSTEMQAINQRFDSEVDVQKDRINQMRQDLNQLKSQRP